MGSRKAEVTILSEDRLQEVFVRRFLIAVGFHPGSFRLVRSPGGVGSGEQFVREHYPQLLDGHIERLTELSPLQRGSWRGFFCERPGSLPDPPQSPLREGGRQKCERL
jgi:hypothetical protein